MDNIVGRSDEIVHLSKIASSGEAELVAVYGRRRVGKTFLIRKFFEKQMAFEFSGIHDATLDQQLENFIGVLSSTTGGLPLARPSNWIQAFRLLADYLTPLIKKQRKVVFLDEFPWINTKRSGFLQAFENFWNSWACKQNNLIIVICGSAASWMIQNVIRNKGGLHNRVTRKIRLMPFTVSETELYLRSRKINLDRYQILQLYMAMGGIPHYLKEIERGESAAQAIDRICFTKDGLLNEEFQNLYLSLFENARAHMEVIRALARKNSGLSRNEIIESCKLTSGGGATQLLEELRESGFITPYIPFDRTAKDALYRLTDEYSLFYIKFIENSRSHGPGTWIKLSNSPSWKSWSGYAFESICMKFSQSLKKALGIENVHTEVSVWRQSAENGLDGAQIDMLIDRRDQCINICEMKFSLNDFEITKSYAKELENKIRVFRERTKTRKSIFLTLVTTYGIKNPDHYAGLVQSQVTMDAFFN
ncbi:MAG: AAA family ATPase [Bacteroidales bacterium]|nr:AAA family ATPase [Bacteroidales bacterium]